MPKSQISIEYILIIAFTTVLAIPLLFIFYKYSSDSTESVAISQTLQISRKIADSVDSVYFLGKPSQTTLKVNFPEGIHSINLSSREVLFRMKTKQGLTDIVQIASVNMSGSLPVTSGIHVITIRADDNFVQISSN
jgi:hypothetical protein